MKLSHPDPVEIARNLMRSSWAALATISAEDTPFASYVITAQAADGSPLLLLSRLAVHTKNLSHRSQASLLLVDEGAVDAAGRMAAARLTLTGSVASDADPESRRMFLARHPEAASYAGFADFGFYRFRIDAGHLVAGFGVIVDLTGQVLLDR